MCYYSSQPGIAGKVSNEGKAIMSNNVSSYFQFIPKIDDPLGKYHNITGVPEEGEVNILTVPIFCRDEDLDDIYQYFPIAVIQTINKINDMPFTKEDMEDTVQCSQFIGQILCKIMTRK